MKHCFPLLTLILFTTACADRNSVKITVSNPMDTERTSEIVELAVDEISGNLNSPYFYVIDSDGNEIPSQITWNGKLIFLSDIGGNSTKFYRVLGSDTLHTYPTVATGRLYPERADDLAWENDLVAFRAYGPTTQARGERAYGYDIFFKHKNDQPMLDTLYAAETSSENWRRVDSLNRIDPQLAQEYRDSFSYHVDHGLGMDCYAVGPTAGDGMSSLIENDSLLFAWCYDSAEVLDNGPLRFTARLKFAPRNVGVDSLVTEYRLISLDKGSRLNQTKVWFDGLEETRDIAVSIPVRDDSEPVIENNYIAYSDPTQGPDNGRALLGAVKSLDFDTIGFIENHIFGSNKFEPSDTLDYYWGFAWDREEIKDMDEWTEYLTDFINKKNNPLKIEY